jgi:hypothetical protein
MPLDTFPRFTADRTAMLECMLALVLGAGDSYLAEFSKLSELACASARRLRAGQACAVLLAELEERAHRARESLLLDINLLRCLHDQVLPTLE